MKLTLKELELLNTATAYNGAQHNEICGRAALELIEYKKIEEELGIDLVTLIKALKQDTLFIKTDIGIKETIKSGEGWAMKILKLEDDKIVIFTDILYPNDITHKEWLTPITLQLSDYKKYWALTKEELE